MKRKYFITRFELQKAINGDLVMQEKIEKLFDCKFDKSLAIWLNSMISKKDERLENVENGPRELLADYKNSMYQRLYVRPFKIMFDDENQVSIREMYTALARFIQKITNVDLTLSDKNVIIDKDSFFIFLRTFGKFIKSKSSDLVNEQLDVMYLRFDNFENTNLVDYSKIAKKRGVTKQRILQILDNIAYKLRRYSNDILNMVNISIFEFEQVYNTKEGKVDTKLFNTLKPKFYFNFSFYKRGFKLDDILDDSKRYIFYFSVLSNSNSADNISLLNPKEIKIENLGLSKRTKNALINAKKIYLSQILDLNLQKLKQIHGIGEKSACEVLRLISQVNSKIISKDNLI